MDGESTTVDSKRRGLTGIGAALLLLVSLAAGFGIPLGWLWVGSMVQGGLNPSMAALVTVLAGITLSYAAFALAVARLNAAGRDRQARAAQRDSWNRSLRDERRVVQRGSRVETTAVVTVLVVATVCTVWFFLYGDPGVRPA